MALVPIRTDAEIVTEELEKFGSSWDRREELRANIIRDQRELIQLEREAKAAMVNVMGAKARIAAGG